MPEHENRSLTTQEPQWDHADWQVEPQAESQDTNDLHQGLPKPPHLRRSHAAHRPSIQLEDRSMI